MTTRLQVLVALSMVLVGSLPSLGQGLTREEANELYGIVAARPTSDEQARGRASRSSEWLASVAGRDLESHSVLRNIAAYYAANDDAARADLRRIIVYLEEHDDRLPFDEFRPVVGRLLMWFGVWLTDNGKWDEATAQFARIARFNADPRSVYWLMGRRARDSEVPEGHSFLQETLIPALLADHRLDDVDRVDVLRRLYAVEYTGPRPFKTVRGPDLAGETRSSDELIGDVSLVLYWATW